MNNFLKRLITGIFLVIAVIFMVWFNRIVLILGLIIISNIAIYEINEALIKMKHSSILSVAYTFNTIFLIASYNFYERNIFPMFTIYIIFLFSMMVLDENISFNKVLSNVFISVYITFPYAYLLFLHKREWVIYAFAITAVTDTFAYIFGTLFGRHKLIERLSPNKSIEGSIGGIIGGLLFTYIFLIIFNIDHRWSIYIAAFFITIISQIGDLFASYIKRISGIKDYGNILMGHGGIMDRFDSLLLVAPIIYILISNLR